MNTQTGNLWFLWVCCCNNQLKPSLVFDCHRSVINPKEHNLAYPRQSNTIYANILFVCKGPTENLEEKTIK